MHSKISSISMTTRIELTSCVEATILGREWCCAWSLVCSECLDEALWLLLYGYGLTGLQVAIPGTLERF
jgi:hypothetical protein